METSAGNKDKQRASTMFGGLVDFSKVDVVDLLSSGAVVVGFLFALFGDKKGESRVWQMSECICLGSYGLMTYLFPSVVLGYSVVGTLDHLHLYVARGIGSSLMVNAVVSLRQYQVNSEDNQVTVGWLLSRVVGFPFLIANGVYGNMSLEKDYMRFTDQALTMTGLGFGLLWIGSLVKLWQHYRSGNLGNGGHIPSKSKPASVLNQHLLLGILLILPGFLLYLMMPGLAIEVTVGAKYDNLHLPLLRIMGGLGLTYTLQEMTGFLYNNDEDKRNFFVGHTLAVALILPLSLLNQFRYSLFSNTALFSSVVGLLLHLANSVYALVISNKDKLN